MDRLDIVKNDADIWWTAEMLTSEFLHLGDRRLTARSHSSLLLFVVGGGGGVFDFFVFDHGRGWWLNVGGEGGGEERERICVCVCVRACVRACVCVCRGIFIVVFMIVDFFVFDCGKE